MRMRASTYFFHEMMAGVNNLDAYFGKKAYILPKTMKFVELPKYEAPCSEK